MDRMSHKCIIIIIKKYNLHAVGTLKRREKRANNFFFNYFSWDRHQTIDLGSLENTKQNKKQKLKLKNLGILYLNYRRTNLENVEISHNFLKT